MAIFNSYVSLPEGTTFCYTGVAAGSRIHLRGAEFTLRNPAPLAARVLGGHEVRMGFGWRLCYFLIDISKNTSQIHQICPNMLYSPRFAWGGRPHRRFISVRERGKNRSKTSCSTMLPIGASQAKQFSLFPPVEASQASRGGFPKLGNFRFSPRGGFPPQARQFSLFPPVGASQAREFSLFPAVTASQAMEFSLFPPLEALQAAEFQIARQRRLDSPPNPVFFECVSMFLQWFPSKHGTLHFCRHKTGRKHHVRQCFQFPYLPNR